MFKKFFATRDDLALTIVRIALGLAILPHGLQKTIGAFGGYGFSGTMGFFTQQAGLPVIVAFLVIVGESLGALGLITGFFSRLSALGVALIMTGAALMVHSQNGFFMNWAGSQKGEGFEYHLLALTLSVVVLIFGAGKFSIDSIVAEKVGA